MSEVLENLANELMRFSGKLIIAVLIIVIGFKFTKFLLNHIKKGRGFQKLEKSTQTFIYSILNILFKGLVLLTAVAELGIPMTSIVAVLGSFGLALGLALQGGLSNIGNVISSSFAQSKREDKIEKEEYYAEAIFSLYDWQKIGIEEFTLEEKNNLIQRLQDEYCLDLYQKLEERGIDRQNIPTILLNTITKSKDFEVTENDTEQTIKEKRLKQYDRILNENIENLNEDLSIERIERFLGYYDVKGTEIKLRSYQQRATDNAREILRENRFASVILPTGAGKSFVALSQLIEHKNEEILYLAPQNEIIEQMKEYIIKYIHGPVNTIRKK